MLYQSLKLKDDVNYEDKIWAYAFKETSNKTGKSLNQPPIYGMIAAGNTQAMHNNFKSQQQLRDWTSYFVPFKKNKQEPVWSKAVYLANRHFADTETEAITAYNELIQAAIDVHQACINELNSCKK